jgi:glyoxylase-like metal-dependent hydrolase (beta-lactamase superfamily II)
MTSWVNCFQQRPATPPPDFDLDVTLNSIELFRALSPTRLLFSHYGPVTEVDDTLDGSIEELRLWVELVRNARTAHLDLDHAVTMIRDKTHERYERLFNDPALSHRFEELNSTGANIVGINRWLDKIENNEYSFGDAAG